MKNTLEDAVRELYVWQRLGADATNFTARLYELIAKADPTNKEALRKGFPIEVTAYEAWQYSVDEAEFFASYGFGPKAGK